MSGKAARDPTSPTATVSSVDYDIVTGRSFHADDGENVDSMGQTAFGIEIKERFKSMRTAFLKMDVNRDGRIAREEIRELCRKWNIPSSEAERIISAADVDENGTLDFNEFAQRFDPCIDEGFGSSQALAPRTTSSSYDDRPVGGKSSRGGGNNSTNKQLSAESAQGSVGYDIITGRAIGAASADNEDSMGMTLMGIEVQERFSSMQDAFLKIDKNRDGRVSRDELRSLCKKWNLPMGEAERVLNSTDTDADGTLDFNEFVERFNPSAAAAASEGGNAESGRASPGGRSSPCGRGSPGGGAASPAGDRQGQAARSLSGGTRSGGLGGGGGGGGASDGLAEECAELRARVAELEAELSADDDPASLEEQIMKTEMELESSEAYERELADRIAALSGGGAAAPRGSPKTRSAPVRARSYVGAEAQPPPVRNVSMDVEMAERFRTMREAFLKCDDNKDGRVSEKELRALCKKWNIPASEAERVVAEADFDDNGTLDFREFARRFGS